MEELQKEVGTMVSQPEAEMQQKTEVQQPTEEQQSAEEPTPKCLGRFNAGAFSFTWIWGMCNGVWSSLLFLIPYGIWVWLAQLGVDTSSYLLYIYGFIIAIAFYLGFYGNASAWEKQKKRKTPEAFDKNQSRWSLAGWIVLGIKVIGIVIFFVSLCV